MLQRKRGRALPYHTTPAKLAKTENMTAISPMDNEKNRIKDIWKDKLRYFQTRKFLFLNKQY